MNWELPKKIRGSANYGDLSWNEIIAKVKSRLSFIGLFELHDRVTDNREELESCKQRLHDCQRKIVAKDDELQLLKTNMGQMIEQMTTM